MKGSGSLLNIKSHNETEVGETLPSVSWYKLRDTQNTAPPQCIVVTKLSEKRQKNTPYLSPLASEAVTDVQGGDICAF